MAATWVVANATGTGVLRFALCMADYDRALAQGVPDYHYVVGTLAACIPCGYHTAVLKEAHGE